MTGISLESLRSLIRCGVVIIPPLVFIKDRVGWVYPVSGASMSPTLNPQLEGPPKKSWIAYAIQQLTPRDRVLVLRNVPSYQQGDIIVARDPRNHIPIVKRIAAMSEELMAKNASPATHGAVSASNGAASSFIEIDRISSTLPKGRVWLAGDNPEVSQDSRVFGPLPLGMVDALVVAVVFPFWRARWLVEG